MRKVKKVALVSTAAAVSLAMVAPAFACTSLGIGKDATADGSVMVSHTCDGWYDHRIQIVEGGKHAAGEMVDIYRDPCFDTKKESEKVGEIPQVEETFTYFNVGYPFMNDKQVMIGEHTWGGRDEVSNPQGLFVIANLEMLGLQRGASAREVVQIMGALAEQYGYCDGGECLIVGDGDECWIFEIVGGGLLWQPDSGKPGAHWAARRLADDEVFVGANRSRIGVIDFNDTENYMWSTDITEMPKENGWWTEAEEFNFTKIFDPTPYSGPFGSSRREWRVFSLIAPSQEFPLYDKTEQYPFSVKPDEPLTVRDIDTIYSDHYEGTEFDLTAGLAAGPFHDPNRWSVNSDQKPDYAVESGHGWERAIAVDRCSYSFVSQSRSWLPDEIGGVLWYGADSPDTTVRVPIYSGTTEIPEEWSTGNRKAFDPDCAWWAFNFVN
ncbi:MAG: C69 family dipeptidase, partial [Eubacteriales bacterium]|nr:C69 family dipeptidase [Eubacteriales bacterium]